MAIIIKKVEKNLGKVTILIIYSLFAFYFIINGRGFFSAWDTNWTFNAIIYVLGVTLFLVVVDSLPRELKSSTTDNIIYFSIFSLIALVVLLSFKDLGLLFTDVAPLPVHLIPANLTFQLIIVASSEEIIFRGIIFGYLYDRFKLRSDKKYGWLIPYFGQAVIFALFHFAVYGIDFSSMFILFLMALIFAYAVERWGIGASIGIHWVWNGVALGAFFIPQIL